MIDAVKMEKMVLAKQVGRFLTADHAEEERAAVENVARVLAQDVCRQVREVLAFELRNCRRLPRDLAERIANDIESVAGPFLEATQVFSPEEFAGLIPYLSEAARIRVARRTDLSDEVAIALAAAGKEPSVTNLVRNDRVILGERACGTVIERFGSNRRMMDQLSARGDLPLRIVEEIVTRVSDHCRTTLIEHYAVAAEIADQITDDSRIEVLWAQIKGASPVQVHAHVTDLRANRRLNHILVVELAERGCPAFMESALALEASLPIGRIREILTLEDPTAFVRLMQMANVSKTMAPRYLRLAKRFATKPADGHAAASPVDTASASAVAAVA